MAIDINQTHLSQIIEHELSEVGGLCEEARCVVANTKNIHGKQVQIQMVVTQEEDQFIYVPDSHTFPITVEE